MANAEADPAPVPDGVAYLRADVRANATDEGAHKIPDEDANKLPDEAPDPLPDGEAHKYPNRFPGRGANAGANAVAVRARADAFPKCPNKTPNGGATVAHGL